MIKFHHLDQVNQTYLTHFYDAISYSYISMKASFCFFVHSIYPDLFEYEGSQLIENLNNILIEKKKKLN